MEYVIAIWPMFIVFAGYAITVEKRLSSIEAKVDMLLIEKGIDPKSIKKKKGC